MMNFYLLASLTLQALPLNGWQHFPYKAKEVEGRPFFLPSAFMAESNFLTAAVGLSSGTVIFSEF